MSKQTGQFGSKEINKTSVPKKRKGPFEVWWRYKKTPEQEQQGSYGWGNLLEWRCMRKYETRELAEKNCEDNYRKWNLVNKDRNYGFQFEVRERKNV